MKPELIFLMMLLSGSFGLFIFGIGYNIGVDNGYSFVVDDNISNVEGVYNHEGYYCVITKNKSFEEIEFVDDHEMCHVLVHRDYEHFCGGKK